MKKYLPFYLIFTGIVFLLLFLFIKNLQKREVVRIFSPYIFLTATWEDYKKKFILPSGQVIDYNSGGETTSEAQSYAMLRAVWIDDKTTFDRVWTWTKNNLQHSNDNLFSWRYGKSGKNIGNYQPKESSNSASDADSDIALALIMANRRWQDKQYLPPATGILSDIWSLETDKVNNNRYLVAGDWAIEDTQDIINPSYFAPYAWRIFSQVDRDPDHDWNGLIAPAYQLLFDTNRDPLNGTKSSGLPPDWVALSKPDGRIRPSDKPGMDTNYSFDALRTPWRIAVDYTWNKDGRAQRYLELLGFLDNVYKGSSQLQLSYAHDGRALSPDENPAIYATALAKLTVTDPGLADKVFKEKILPLYSTETNSFRGKIPYYEANWLWFGTAFYFHNIISF